MKGKLFRSEDWKYSLRSISLVNFVRSVTSIAIAKNPPERRLKRQQEEASKKFKEQEAKEKAAKKNSEETNKQKTSDQVTSQLDKSNKKQDNSAFKNPNNESVNPKNIPGTGSQAQTLKTQSNTADSTRREQKQPAVNQIPANKTNLKDVLNFSGPKVTYVDVVMQRKLDKIAEFLKSNPNSVLYIEGHTDNFGTPDDQKRISEQRASEVRTYLVVKKGIEGNRAFASGKGSSFPVADNLTEVNRKKNRRVELRIAN